MGFPGREPRGTSVPSFHVETARRIFYDSFFPFLIRYERNIKRNSEKFPFSQNERKYKEVLLKKHAFFFPLVFWVHKVRKLFLLLFV